ncbi:MAG: hypothetical protein PHN82_09795 [bacterium]|nr:hypothetical protein [bacterium]
MRTAAGLLAWAAASALAAAAEPAAFPRHADPVVVRGDRLAPLAGVPVGRLALYAVRDGKGAPLPFQVDERNAAGALSLTGPSGRPVNQDDGLFDGNDELVFMGGDLGGRAAGGELPSAATAAVEIECRDPRTGAAGYAYCVAMPAPVPYEGHRYVRYDPARDYVTADRYELGYEPGGMKSYFSTLILKNGPAGRSPDILDRFKFRVDITFFFAIVSVSRNEDDMKSVLVGWRDGLVRAVRECDNSLYLKFGIRSPSSVVDNYYYRDSIEWPTYISLPFNVATIATEAHLTSGCDWNEAATGMTYYNSRNRAPVLVDGVMSEAERRLDRSPYDWSALSGSQGTIMSRLWLSESLVMEKELLYIDDRTIEDPPEGCSGHWGYNGWRFNITTVPKGTHTFISYFYFPADGGPEAEEAYLDILDRPLEVSTRPLDPAD